MGREAKGRIELDGRAAEATLLLEADVLVIRGALRRQWPRAGLSGWHAEGDDLVIGTPEGPLRAALGAKEAARWLRALDRPAPSLADKLGAGPARRVWLVGRAEEAELAAALSGALAAGPEEAALSLAEITSEAALAALLPVLPPHLPFWAVSVKGKDSPLPEARLRAALRGLGWRDTKTCAVSARMTATRFHPPGATPQPQGA